MHNNIYNQFVQTFTWCMESILPATLGKEIQIFSSSKKIPSINSKEKHARDERTVSNCIQLFKKIYAPKTKIIVNEHANEYPFERSFKRTSLTKSHQVREVSESFQQKGQYQIILETSSNNTITRQDSVIETLRQKFSTLKEHMTTRF